MYYSSDRHYAIYVLLTAVFYLLITCLVSYFGFQSINTSRCKVLDVVNMTDGKTTDIAFIVQDGDNQDIAFGTDYYYVGNSYTCYQIMGIHILDDGKSYISIIAGLGIANLVFVATLVLIIILRTIYIYKVTREFSYLNN